MNKTTFSKIVIGTLTLVFLFLCAYLISPYNTGMTSILNGFLALINISLVSITTLSENRFSRYQKESIIELKKEIHLTKAEKFILI